MNLDFEWMVVIVVLIICITILVGMHLDYKHREKNR